MAEYIERKAAISALEKIDRESNAEMTIEDVRFCLISIPAADVAPVRHGRFENSKNYKGHLFWCSICNHCAQEKIRYCPNCGAKMDGGAP